jgi:hypothetical protein
VSVSAKILIFLSLRRFLPAHIYPQVVPPTHRTRCVYLGPHIFHHWGDFWLPTAAARRCSTPSALSQIPLLLPHVDDRDTPTAAPPATARAHGFIRWSYGAVRGLEGRAKKGVGRWAMRASIPVASDWETWEHDTTKGLPLDVISLDSTTIVHMHRREHVGGRWWRPQWRWSSLHCRSRSMSGGKVSPVIPRKDLFLVRRPPGRGSFKGLDHLHQGAIQSLDGRNKEEGNISCAHQLRMHTMHTLTTYVGSPSCGQIDS